jgi:uncharacterized protein YyaL (SSP411 family)
VPGFLEDYAFVAEALLDLWEADFDIRWLREARRLAGEMLELFWDEGSQRFSSSGPRHEKLIAAVPALQDDPFPSGNAAAVHLLLRLSVLANESEYEVKAEKVLRSLSGVMEQSPAAVTHLLSGLHRYLSPAIQIVIVSGDNPQEAESHLAPARRVYLPNAVVVFKGTDNSESLETLAPLVQGKSPVNRGTTTYLCVGRTCLAPITDSGELETKLREVQRAPSPYR